jgi:amidohydrolase
MNTLFEHVTRRAAETAPQLIALRREIHAHPELSGEEYDTARRVYTWLKSRGIQVKYYVHKTGVAATIIHGHGPTVVIRADMDALPIQEMKEVPYTSTVRRVMHACGHDMHTAILCGTAQILSECTARWNGRVVFLFQPSEEVEPGGAKAMIAQKAFPRRVDAVFGLHVSTDHPAGSIGIKKGEDYSGVLTFDVTVKGKGGHGGTPNKTIDPIVCAASMVGSLQTLVSRECDPMESAVITIGSFHGGTKRNVIPDEACFQGTVRTFSDSLQKRLQRRIKTMLTAIAHSQRAKVSIEFMPSYPGGYNDPSLTDRAEKVLGAVLGKRKVIQRIHPTAYSEDFAYYQQRAPGVYLHLGVRPRGARDVPGIHTARFAPDESAIQTGVIAECALALDMLGSSEENDSQ